MSDSFTERDRAAEAAYFNQEDAIALKQLQEKLRASAKSKKPEAVRAAVTSEIDELRAIMAPHNLPEHILHGASLCVCEHLSLVLHAGRFLAFGSLCSLRKLSAPPLCLLAFTWTFPV